MTLILVLIISLISAFAFSQGEVMAKMQFNAYKIYHRRQIYRMVTHAFVHANWEHLIVNMLVLFSFGKNVEHFFGIDFGALGGA